MRIHNMEVAVIFNKLANLLEIEGANPFRIRAYRNAARIIGGFSKNVSDLIAQGSDLSELPGIGKDLAEKITTIVKTGSLPLLKETEKRIPPILNELMSIEGLGPKRIQILYKKLGIKSISDLKAAITKGRLQTLHGFGEKIQEKIHQGINFLDERNKRTKLVDMVSIVASITRHLHKLKAIKHIECAGSFRRHKETVGDLDFIATTTQREKAIAHFTSFDEIAEILAQGITRSTVRLHSGIQVDLRVVPEESYGAALVYFTGSKEHNIAIRKLALQKKLKINEYGVFKRSKQIAGATENDVYREIGLAYIEPELREDRGEIEAAKKNCLPTLITLKDIRGDLHCHTNQTDGNASLDQMVNASLARGYEYLAITDHSQHLAMVHGLNERGLLKQIKLIDKLNERLKKIVILKSIEVDILEDGSLDLSNDVLKELDLVVGSIHSHFNLSEKKQTERLIRAMDNPYFSILGHPTGRLINERNSYPIDIEKIMHAAFERRCVLELNSQPERLDLDDKLCQLAKEIGINIAISTDAHSPAQLDYMEFGIYQARRGWLEKENVINTWPLAVLRKRLKR